MAELANYLHLTTAANYGPAGTGKGSDVRLMAVNVGTGAASGVITIYDGTSNAGVVVTVIDASAKGSFWFGGCRLVNGIFAVVSGATIDATITYI